MKWLYHGKSWDWDVQIQLKTHFPSSQFNCLEIRPNNKQSRKKTKRIRASIQRFFFHRRIGLRNRASTENPLCVSARVFLNDLHAFGYATSHQSHAASRKLNDERCEWLPAQNENFSCNGNKLPKTQGCKKVREKVNGGFHIDQPKK